MTGILLVNLGSPDSTEIPDVKKYLDEFLMDKRVIDYNYIKRLILIRGIILRSRPAQTSEAYKSIWNPQTGSPLVHLSYQFLDKFRHKTDLPVALSMRYGSPTIESGMRELVEKGVKHIVVVPLYPQYAMSSYETVWVEALDVRDKHFNSIELTTVAPFYNDEDYIAAMSQHIQAHLPADYDKILFSFHGIPERHIRRYAHDQPIKNFDECYHSTQEAHNSICYIHQCHRSMELMMQALNIPKDKYAFSYQSRLGREKWMDPYTDKCFEEYPKRGIKKLVVLCPAFVTDCLETLEEINMEGREEFLEHGGEAFTYIPCLNVEDHWVEALHNIVSKSLQSAYYPRLLMGR